MGKTNFNIIFAAIQADENKKHSCNTFGFTGGSLKRGVDGRPRSGGSDGSGSSGSVPSGHTITGDISDGSGQYPEIPSTLANGGHVQGKMTFTRYPSYPIETTSTDYVSPRDEPQLPPSTSFGNINTISDYGVTSARSASNRIYGSGTNRPFNGGNALSGTYEFSNEYSTDECYPYRAQQSITPGLYNPIHYQVSEPVYARQIAAPPSHGMNQAVPVFQYNTDAPFIAPPQENGLPPNPEDDDDVEQRFLGIGNSRSETAFPPYSNTSPSRVSGPYAQYSSPITQMEVADGFSNQTGALV